MSQCAEDAQETVPVKNVIQPEQVVTLSTKALARGSLRGLKE